MSWVQLHGETWPATYHVAEVKLYLRRPDAQCQRQEWILEWMHLVPRECPPPGACPTEKSLSVRLGTMGFDLHDWRELAGKELRADAAWHEQHGRSGEYGRLVETSLEASQLTFYDPANRESEMTVEQTWRAHDFVIRFGRRDGLSFPMELDAWLIPDKKFWRREPESPAELARFGEAPPDLRVMATAYFTEGWVCLPACDDPPALARRWLREEIAFEEMHDPQIQWATRTRPGTDEREEVREWPPRVHFRTEPGHARRWRGTQEA